MVKRKSEFVGFRDDVIHGQRVRVKVYRQICEPTIDLDKAIQGVCEATPGGVEGLRDQFEKYIEEKKNYEDVELELNADDRHDYSVNRPQPDLIISDIRSIDDPITVDEDIPLTNGGDPYTVDGYIRMKNKRGEYEDE
jgi:hypothetical protein